MAKRVQKCEFVFSIISAVFAPIDSVIFDSLHYASVLPVAEISGLNQMVVMQL